MKMSKTDPETTIEIDMTPMIDVVFQLIIFFMLLMDMSQDELEQLHLPVAVTASPDEPDPTVIRPVINILSTGEILVKRALLYDPNADDQYSKLKEFLAGMAKRMPKEPLNEDQPNGPKVPANAILIRADRSTPFKHIQKVMEVCGIQDIQIWKVQLAAAEAAPAEGTGAAAPAPHN
jgi:biopolymer transport protein ExbD